MLRQLVRQRPLLAYFVLSYTISWAIWLVGVALGQASSLETFAVFLFLGSFGPALAGLTVAACEGGAAGVRSLLLRLIQVRVRFPVYLAVWFIFPAVVACGLWLLKFPFKTGAALNILSLIVAMPINGFLTAFLSPGPLGEELGWRGTALPRMIGWGEWPSSLGLGLIWAFWHLPVAILFPSWREPFPGLEVDLFPWLVLYPVSLMAVTVMLTKLWKWSSGSIFVCILFHGVVNATFQITDKVSSPYSALSAFALLDGLLWLAALVFIGLDRIVFSANRAQKPIPTS